MTDVLDSSKELKYAALAMHPEDFYNSFSDQYEKIILAADYYKTLYEMQRYVLKQYLIKQKKKMYALDVGCGTGLYCNELYRLNCKVVGIDASKKMVQIAKHNIKKRKLNHDIIILHGYAEKIDFPSNSFDVVIAFGSIINCVKDVHVAIKEFLRVLKPGGIAIFDIENSIGLDYNNNTFLNFLSQIWKAMLREQKPKSFMWPFYLSKNPKWIKMQFFDHRLIRRIAIENGAKEVKIYGVHFLTNWLPGTLNSATLKNPRISGFERLLYKAFKFLDKVLMNIPLLKNLVNKLGSNQIIVIRK
ncbi:MAG: class I SAM-dependent methyltransferase [Candidatus Bathyarchaeia archaeon]